MNVDESGIATNAPETVAPADVETVEMAHTHRVESEWQVLSRIEKGIEELDNQLDAQLLVLVNNVG